MHIIEPNLVVQAVLETISAMPVRKIGKVLLIPGYGNNSTSKRAGIQSCYVATLLSLANVRIDRLEGIVHYI